MDTPYDEPVRIPIGPELDLHTFAPGELGVVLPAYLEACVERGLSEVRVIHGKGTGALRNSVLTMLTRSPWVLSYRQADPVAGGWGATLVRLDLRRRKVKDAG